MLGCNEVVLIAIINADKEVFLCLDFDESVDLEAPSVIFRFQQAWADLLAVQLEWIRGRNVLLIECLNEIYEERIRQLSSGYPSA